MNNNITLESAIAAENNRHKEAIKWIKTKFKFKTANPKEQAKILNKTSSVKLWELCNQGDRIKIASILLKKAHCAKVWISAGHGLDISTFKISNNVRYSVHLILRKGMFTIIASGLSTSPTDEELLNMVKNMFPSIKIIQKS